MNKPRDIYTSKENVTMMIIIFLVLFCVTTAIAFRVHIFALVAALIALGMVLYVRRIH